MIIGQYYSDIDVLRLLVLVLLYMNFWTVTVFLLAILLIANKYNCKLKLESSDYNTTFTFQLNCISTLIHNHFTCWKLEGCLVSTNSVREHNPSATKTLESHNKPNMYFCSTLAIYCCQFGSWTNGITWTLCFQSLSPTQWNRNTWFVYKSWISSLILIS